MKRFKALGLAAATIATTVTAVVSGAGTATAAYLSCKPVANIFTMQADGDLWRYQHAGAADGSFNWTGATQVGWGWGGKTFAGPNGWLFNITTGGELRRLRYNGSGWDTFPGGGQYETFGWGWQKFVEPANRGKITVDVDGSFYTLEGDQLRWWHYEQDARQWAPGSGRVLDVGWSRFDLIAASGSGGLQARDSSGALHRFRYHRGTERFMAYDQSAAGWQGHSKLFSAGGDAYYAVRPDTGQLLWNKYDESDSYGQWTSGGLVVGSGWGTDIDITATTNDCAVNGLRQPAPVGGWGSPSSPARYITPGSGSTHVVGVNGNREVVDTYSTGSGWATRVVGSQFGGVSSPVYDDEAGTAVIGVTEYETGDAKLFTLKNGQWQAPVSLKGGLSGTPAVVRRSDGTLALYAMGQNNENPRRGRGFVREQLPSGEFGAWRPFGEVSSNYLITPSVISRGDETTIAFTTDRSTEWFRHTPGAIPVRKGTLINRSAVVALAGDGQDGILAVSTFIQNEKNEIGLLREKADRSGFEATWELVGGALPDWLDSTSMDAQVLPNGSTAVTVLAGGRPLVTTSKAAGGRDFHPWARVVPDPPAFRFLPGLGLTRAGDVALVARDDTNAHLWTASVTPDPAAPLQFTGGKLG
ncbi:tachylectin-related carbohydrate-binding protein [Lentzea aerocolonigenes]|uniref:tachylectin-related carbohydrate-binding protein n=1 Tax=Lentzea aerocolonigenes TaxID=68170 RepID=UPI0004C2E089|nr:tachylectin-related carbohydrate-binding protein [Lentzea aerocolonigenes]MCP2246899.1 Tachylectin [Lentzea aerocolonigenes]